MIGKAKLDIPRVGTIGPSQLSGISDTMAMSFGRLAAMTLSEQDGHVLVTLQSGSVRVIGYCTATDTVVIGRLHPNHEPPYRTQKIIRASA